MDAALVCLNALFYYTAYCYSSFFLEIKDSFNFTSSDLTTFELRLASYTSPYLFHPKSSA